MHAKPPVNDDVVYVHAAVEGWKGRDLSRDEYVRSFYPKKIAGTEWKAISWTTAASLCSIIEMAAIGKLPEKGFVKQETIPLSEFFKTPTGSLFLQDGKSS